MKKIIVKKLGKYNVLLNIAAASLKGSGKLEGFKMNLDDGLQVSIELIESNYASKDFRFDLKSDVAQLSDMESGKCDLDISGSGESKYVVRGMKISQGANLVEIKEMELDSLSEVMEFALQFSGSSEGDYEVYKDK